MGEGLANTVSIITSLVHCLGCSTTEREVYLYLAEDEWVNRATYGEIAEAIKARKTGEFIFPAERPRGNITFGS